VVQDDKMAKIILKDISFQIMAAAFEVHNTLGFGFLENVYEKSLLKELQLRAIPAECQKELKVFYKSACVGSYVADIVVNDEIILELKAVENLNRCHEAQLLNYLKATGYKLGLLINFGKEKVEHKRLVL
jgi:GxxExxY protein